MLSRCAHFCFEKKNRNTHFSSQLSPFYTIFSLRAANSNSLPTSLHFHAHFIQPQLKQPVHDPAAQSFWKLLLTVPQGVKLSTSAHYKSAQQFHRFILLARQNWHEATVGGKKSRVNFKYSVSIEQRKQFCRLYGLLKQTKVVNNLQSVMRCYTTELPNTPRCVASVTQHKDHL